MGISSLNHFSIVLLVLLCFTSAYAGRSLVDSNVSEKNDDSMKKIITVDQKCNGGGKPTCPGQGSGNCQCQGSGNCQCQGSGNCGGQCQGSGNCAGQCQGSCSGCVSYGSCCVQYVPICQVPCSCARGNSGGGYAYGNEKWKKIEGPHGSHVRMIPTNGAVTQVNNGVDNEAHLVKPKEIDEERNQNPTVSTNEATTHKVDMSNSEVHDKAHVHMVTTNGAMTNGADMANNGLHGESDVVTVGEPVKPNMGDEVFHENEKH